MSYLRIKAWKIGERVGFCNSNSEQQAREVLERFDLAGQVQRFRRCSLYNGLTQPVEKKAIFDQLEPLTQKYYTEFFQCMEGRKIYWKGSHYDRIQKKLTCINRPHHQ